MLEFWDALNIDIHGRTGHSSILIWSGHHRHSEGFRLCLPQPDPGESSPTLCTGVACCSMEFRIRGHSNLYSKSNANNTHEQYAVPRIRSKSSRKKRKPKKRHQSGRFLHFKDKSQN